MRDQGSLFRHLRTTRYSMSAVRRTIWALNTVDGIAKSILTGPFEGVNKDDRHLYIFLTKVGV